MSRLACLPELLCFIGISRVGVAGKAPDTSCIVAPAFANAHQVVRK